MKGKLFLFDWHICLKLNNKRNASLYIFFIDMKYFLYLLFALLPLHAFLVTVLKCKFGVDTNLLRFWKEFIVLILLAWVFIHKYRKFSSIIKVLWENALTSWVSAFILCSTFFIFFPFMEIKPASMLWFRYDVFFFFALLIWMSGLVSIALLKRCLAILFVSSGTVLTIFLPWYMFGDISLLAQFFGYSTEVSTYNPNSCISFSQNVNGEHRFQWSFGGPIRFSVFLTVMLSLFWGYILSLSKLHIKTKTLVLSFATLFTLLSIFFSFSKTSLLGAWLVAFLFFLLHHSIIARKRISKKMFYISAWVFGILVSIVWLLNWKLFLHLWAILNRLDNLSTSIEMFFYNPFWYGLGIAGPASQIGNSIESAGSWHIATANATTVHKFLPENWYVQILLEQWIVGFFLFIACIIMIGVMLWNRLKKYKSPLILWVFCSYIWLCFMALFTHAFEEAATSYILFFVIWVILANYKAWSKKKSS